MPKMPTVEEDVAANAAALGDLFPACHCFNKRGPVVFGLERDTVDMSAGIATHMIEKAVCPKAVPYVLASITAHTLLMYDSQEAFLEAKTNGVPEIDKRVAAGEDMLAVLAETTEKRILDMGKMTIDCFNRLMPDLNKRSMDFATAMDAEQGGAAR